MPFWNEFLFKTTSEVLLKRKHLLSYFSHFFPSQHLYAFKRLKICTPAFSAIFILKPNFEFLLKAFSFFIFTKALYHQILTFWNLLLFFLFVFFSANIFSNFYFQNIFFIHKPVLLLLYDYPLSHILFIFRWLFNFSGNISFFSYGFQVILSTF